MQAKTQTLRRALRAAFPHTIPIFAGYSFLGMTFGILMSTSGFGFGYSVLMAVIIFAGSMQFMAVSILLAPFAPLQALAMTLILNARHLFYGLAMLDRIPAGGLRRIYTIFGLTDETFSVTCGTEVPEDVDRGWFMFFVTLLDQCWWVLGCTAGGVFGAFLRFNTQGLDFVMTAMFVVIFLEQWLKDENHTSALTGTGLSLLCLLIFGPENFIIPAMLAILAALTLLRRRLEGEEAAA